MNNIIFSTKLFRYPGKGGWLFAPVPDEYAPPVTHSFGRTPVLAKMDAIEWETSVWRDKSGKTLLPIPKKIHDGKVAGDIVRIALDFRIS